MPENHDPRRVILVSNALVPRNGGVPKTMHKFAEAIEAEIVSFTSRRIPEAEREAFPKVRHILTSRNPVLDKYAYAWPDDRRPAEELAASAALLSCHVMLRYQANFVMNMAAAHGIPYWFVPHGQLDPHVYTYRAWIKHLWLKKYGRKMLSEAAHVIFSTEQEREKAKWFYDGPNTRVVHWPVDLIDDSNRREARKALRERLGLADGSRILLFLGRLHSMKRPLETVEAVARAGATNVDLVMVGPEEGITAGQCRAVARSYGFENRLHITGPVYGGDKEELIRGADAYISLSKRENFGHTAAENLAAGNPVILSPGNDLSPELRAYRCGWFLESDAISEATSAVDAFAKVSEAESEAMGLRGRAFVEKTCSFAGFRDRLLALKDEAIAGRAPLS